MGYTVDMFMDIKKLDLISDKVLDIGAQDVFIMSAHDLEKLNQFIGNKKPDKIISLTSFPAVLEANGAGPCQ